MEFTYLVEAAVAELGKQPAIILNVCIYYIIYDSSAHTR